MTAYSGVRLYTVIPDRALCTVTCCISVHCSVLFLDSPVSGFHYSHQHKPNIITDSLHHADHTREAIKLVVVGIHIEGEGGDGENTGQRP